MVLRFKPGGVGQMFDPERRCVEVPTSTCSHCQRITEISSVRRMMDYVEICRGCMKLICLQCAGKPCVTWLKKCEIEEAEFARRQRASL
jgi:hypothetical protein